MPASVARYACFLAAAELVHAATDRNLAAPLLAAPTRRALPGLPRSRAIGFHGNSAGASNGKQRSWLGPAEDTRLTAREASKQSPLSGEAPSSHGGWGTGSKKQGFGARLAAGRLSSRQEETQGARNTITWCSARTRAAQVCC